MKPNHPLQTGSAGSFSEDVEVSGHIIDSLILPKILDHITTAGGAFEIKKIAVGNARTDPSFALIEVQAHSPQHLGEILSQISDHGAVVTRERDCRLEVTDADGAFPEGFYASTNHRSQIRIDEQWIDVDDQEMDCGIVLDAGGKASNGKTARCIAMSDVRRGMSIVVGHRGVRVFPQQRATSEHQSFEFMNSAVSTEKPKGVAIRQIAEQLHKTRRQGKKTVLVGGPAIVHTGSGPHLCHLIREGYVDVLLAGNALATHDIEQSIYGTSLGVHLDRGDVVEAGHEHHLRAINRIRRAGGISSAVSSGLLTSGIMYECVTNDVPFMLAGSIRDDGPLPEVVTDVIEAQRQMRTLIGGASFCLMIATTLHSIAVGNLLPDWVKVVCVDINPSTVIKLADRGSHQTIGLVTDVEPFLRSLVEELKRMSTFSSSKLPVSRTR